MRLASNIWFKRLNVNVNLLSDANKKQPGSGDAVFVVLGEQPIQNGLISKKNPVCHWSQYGTAVQELTTIRTVVTKMYPSAANDSTAKQPRPGGSAHSNTRRAIA